MAKAQVTIFEFDGYRIPVRIYKEWRGSVRYSLAKKNAILRVPRVMPFLSIKNELLLLEDWIKKHIEKDPTIAQRFKFKSYQTGDTIKVRDRIFSINLFYENRKTNTAKIKRGDIIDIRISDSLDKYQKTEATQKLLISVLGKFYKPYVISRVKYYNDNFFHERIESVKLKNNQSNWGSCSTKKNINLSSRLILAPEDVLDYVIVHELSHLKEMNHSPKFWKIVKNVMPDYEDKELWLKKNGHSLIF